MANKKMSKYAAKKMSMAQYEKSDMDKKADKRELAAYNKKVGKRK